MMHPILAHLGEKLLVALLPPEEPDDKHASPIDGEQGADAVELVAEDLEDDEGKGELREGGTHVGAFEGALGGAHFDYLVGRQSDGASAVQAKVVTVSSAALFTS